MTTASAKVIIDAEDLASKKIEEAARNVEKNVKQIKEVGGQAKASTEFIGTLAATLGGSELGSYAGQLAQLTERVSAFSEVSKAGGAGALAFKAGLVGLVGTLAFSVGKAIGDVVFQTERWTRELEAAAAAADELNAAVLRATANAFSGEMEQIELIRDPEEQKQAIQGLLEQIDKDIDAKNSQIASYQKQIADVDETWGGFFSKVSGDVRAINEANKVQVEEAKKQKDLLKEQALELRKRLSAEQESMQLQREKNALQEKSDAYLESLRQELELLKASKDEVIAITAARNTTAEDRGVAEQLLRERDSILQRQEAEKEASKIAEQAAKARESSIQKLQAEQERLQETMANEAAALGRRMNAETSLTGSQSRLLSRGPGDDQQKQIVDNTKKTADRLDEVRAELEKLNQLRSVPVNQRIEVVG